jgi:hypothetical protein
MITVEMLDQLTKMKPHGLSEILNHSGYKGCFFKRAQFVGITNGGQFAYKVVYHDDAGTGKDAVGKVFVSYNHSSGDFTADF